MKIKSEKVKEHFNPVRLILTIENKLELEAIHALFWADDFELEDAFISYKNSKSASSFSPDEDAECFTDFSVEVNQELNSIKNELEVKNSD